MSLDIARRLPIGAEVGPDGVHFRIWAPRCNRLRVELVDHSTTIVDLEREEDGYFAGLAVGAAAGTRYWLLVDDSPQRHSDPASRFQPDGPQGSSCVVDPRVYSWHDDAWQGIATRGHVVYEMHIGTFTSEGTWQAAARRLAELSRLGVTVLEIMPVAEFPGEFGWSYDATHLFAPSHLYGVPDDFRSFVDEAHRFGIGVTLDVVFNHFSRRCEQVVSTLSATYVSSRYKSDWGAAVNFDGPGSAGVREFFRACVEQWIGEFHLDGLRIDATQAFFDNSPVHILLELNRTARRAAGDRSILIIGENEPQHANLLRAADRGGCEFDAIWNDDFHHAAMVRATGRREAYYHDYTGTAEEFVAGARWGYLFQGQRYAWQKNRRGTPALDISPWRFINYLQNHDQLANSARGERIHQLTSPGRYRALTALLLLGPQTPLLFQGQEFAADSPFLYFNDYPADEAERVIRGRAEFLSQFASLAGSEAQAHLPDPRDRRHFERSKLDWSELNHQAVYCLHRDLLALRREDPVLLAAGEVRPDGAALSDDLLMLRFSPESDATRLLVINFGSELWLESVSHPLAAPPARMRWSTLWSSHDLLYGGPGTFDLETPDGWHIPGEAAVLLHPVPDE